MANDRVASGDVAAELPELSGRLRPPLPQLEPLTLAGRLVPTADKIRNLYARFGVHIYRVFLVHASWTGGKRGVGELQVTARREILPVPRVRDYDSVRRGIRSTGVTEEGDIVVDRISPKYAEDDLLGKTPDLVDPSLPRTSRPDVQFWWEIEENRPSTPNPMIRRFSPPAAVPFLKRDAFQWSVTLTKQAGDRGRRGSTDPVDL
jgi:hypothetical protein